MDIDLATRLEAGIEDALAHNDLARAETLAQQYLRAAADDATARLELSPRFRSRWLAARVALDAGQLQETVRRIATVLPLPADFPAALANRIYLAAAEVFARLRRLVQAREFLGRVRPPLEPLLQLRELRIRLWLGEVETLGTACDDCAATLERLGDAANLALLLCEQGRAFDAADRLERAAECWTRAELVATPLGRHPIRADILLQQGRLAHLRGQLKAALDRYDEATSSTGLPQQRSEVALRRLLVLLDLNQQAQARNEWERLRPSLSDVPEELRPLTAMVRCLFEGGSTNLEGSGFESAQRGDLAEARTQYAQAFGETRSPARQARLALALGMLAVSAGNATEARHWLTRARDLAESEDLPEVRWRAIQAEGSLAAELEGDDERARQLYEQAVLHAEAQARTLTHRVDAAAYGMRRSDVLQRLLRAACRRRDAAAVFRYQELQRGRLLLELWRASTSHTRLADSTRLRQLDADLAALPPEQNQRRAELLLEQDRLFDEHLRDRSRANTAALPSIPELAELRAALAPDTLYVAPSVVAGELYLLVVQTGGAEVVALGDAHDLEAALARLRSCISEQLCRYQTGVPLGNLERDDLDHALAEIGRLPLGEVLWQRLDSSPSQRLLWVPEGPLHGMPVAALRRGGRYLIERHDVIFGFGGSLLVHQARTRARRGWFAPALVLTEAPEVLPSAAEEGRGVAATFWRTRRLAGSAASCSALRANLRSACVAHLACHAYFDPQRPLSATIGLPSGELWRALQWLDEPLEGLPLVTLSACRSAEVGPLIGREVFGLVTGLLGAGVRSVVAGLWPVADREAQPFMWRFYRERMLADVPVALARAQRAALASGGASPLFWGAFAFFGDARALPAPGWLGRWVARRRAMRHARRFADGYLAGEG